MRRFAILLVILFFSFTLVTVDSGGHQRNAIDTLYTTTTDSSSNYTKNVLTHNSSFNATIVLPLTANSSAASSVSSSSSGASNASFAGSKLAVQTFSALTPVPTVIVSGADTSAADFIATSKASSVLRDKRGTTLNPAEIARQNQITQQILSHYLERRLHPERVVAQKIPTIADILPKPTISTTTTTTTKPKQRGKARGFSISSSSRKKGSSGRKTYGQRKPLNSLYDRKNIRKEENKQSSAEDYPDDAELERDDEDNSGNKTLNNDRLQPYEDDEEFDDEEDVEFPVKRVEPSHSSSRHHQRYRQQQHVYHPFYRNRYYEDNIEQESLQSFESEQHDSLYRNREVALSRDPSENEIDSDYPQCVDETPYANKWTMPLVKLGEKRYYLGIFFKANWFKANQYCRYHGMHLASVSSQEENDRLETHIKDFGLGQEHFWTSGTDLADEGNFFWMATGRPITFTNWNAGEPNNFRYENGEEENCLELWNRDGKGLKWNDSPCSFETYFVCEIQP